jgi:feruloyl esterase
MQRFSALSIVLIGALLLAGCGSTEGGPKNAKEAGQKNPNQRCSALEGRKIGFGEVTDAYHVVAGEELVSMSKRLFVKTLLSIDLPPVPAPRSFCRVEASLTPVAGSLVKVQIWLPDDWNGKLLAKGGGGFNGGLFSASISMRDGMKKRYVTVVSDVGHDNSDSAKFAHESREAFIDYGYRGNHSTAVFTKQLISAYFGKPPRLAYFEGGSNGGREALMEARRYPEDYDGIIAGMPAMSFTKLMTSFLWNAEAIRSAPGLKSKLGLVRKAVLAECDALDGVTDGVLDSPTKCAFDPADLQCKGGESSDCLSVAEFSALKKIHDGPRLKDGASLFPGLAIGVEVHPTEMDSWILGEKALQPSMGQEAFRWMVYGDSTWDSSRFDIDVDAPAAAKIASILDSDDPDLSAFLERDGKLLMHHGWNDAAIPPTNTIHYYESVLQKLGPRAKDQVRLFMVPGMGHGLGRPGPEYYDMLSVLERWVEAGEAPGQIHAYQYVSPPSVFIGPEADSKISRTMVLCAWPAVPSYNGSGSTDDAANFACK